MDAKVKQAWIQALRGGEYEQARGTLRAQGQFCCLGVLCDLHAKETGNTWRPAPNGTQTYLGEGECLPSAVYRWAGLEGFNPYVKAAQQYALAEYNDGDCGLAPHSFEEIADLIEQHL